MKKNRKQRGLLWPNCVSPSLFDKESPQLSSIDKNRLDLSFNASVNKSDKQSNIINLSFVAFI